MSSSFPAGNQGAVPRLPRPFLPHMAKQSPWVALAGAPPAIQTSPACPGAAWGSLPLLHTSHALCAASTFLKDGCTSTPRPLSTLQLSLDEVGHSCHEPSRVPDSLLLLGGKKKKIPPEKAISPHELSPSLAPGHPWHSKGQLQSPEVALWQRTLWLSCHLPHPGSNPASPACN